MEPLPQFDGALVRPLKERELTLDHAPEFPIVIEPLGNRSAGSLSDFLSRHSESLAALLHARGAVLLRGFRVHDEAAFEASVLKLNFFRPMGGYFMSEPGRTLVGKTKYVFHTNEIHKTGGGLSPPGRFHSENLGTLDVPRLVVFWCKHASPVGGETGLIHTGRLCDALDPHLVAKLEGINVITRTFPLDRVARRYGLQMDTLARFLCEEGIPLTDGTAESERTISERALLNNGRDELANQHTLVVVKPTVFHDAYNGKKSLFAPLSFEFPEFDTILNHCLSPHYLRPMWWMHRYVWQRPRLMAFLQKVLETKVSHKSRVLREPTESTRRFSLVADQVTNEESMALSLQALEDLCLFAWKRDDVLLLDNVQVQHTGMPGLGTRTIRVMLGNPIALASGPVAVALGPFHNPPATTLEERLKDLARRSTGRN